jgi:hypothetical protein
MVSTAVAKLRICYTSLCRWKCTKYEVLITVLLKIRVLRNHSLTKVMTKLFLRKLQFRLL